MGLLAGVLESLGPLGSSLAQLPTWQLVAVSTVSFVVVSIVLNVLQQLLCKDPKKPPMVFHIFPFFGSTVIYGMEPYKFFNNCQKKYGDVFTFILLGRKITVCLGPKGNDFIFNGRLTDVSAEDAYTNFTTPVFGEGVVYDCPNHRLMEQKKFMKFGLTTETFKTYVPLIVGQVEDYNKGSGFFKGATGKVNVMDIIPELTIYTASRSLQGKEVREGLNGEVAKMVHDLDMGFTPVNFLLPWFPFPHNRRRDAARKQLASFYQGVISKRRAEGGKEARTKDGEPKTDMVWNLMDRSYRDGVPVTDRDVSHMMIALLMAGQHTSMATTCWTLLHLAEKPELQKALIEEQYSVFGDGNGGLEPVYYEKIASLTILNNVVKEILRMHPPLHSIIRKVKQPLTVPYTNQVIPESHYVLAAPGVSALDEKYFPNPHTFDPYRWENKATTDAAETAEQHDFGFGLISKGTASPYLPFGAGRHRCIGEQFANVQLGSILSTMVRTFEFSLPKEGPFKGRVPDVDYTSMIALPAAPAEVCWRKRNP